MTLNVNDAKYFNIKMQVNRINKRVQETFHWQNTQARSTAYLHQHNKWND